MKKLLCLLGLHHWGYRLERGSYGMGMERYQNDIREADKIIQQLVEEAHQ